MFTSSSCSSTGIPACPVTNPCQKNANMLVGLHRTCRECWGCQPEHEQGPHMECFPRCHFLIPSDVFESRSLVKLKYTEIVLGSVLHSMKPLTSIHLTYSGETRIQLQFLKGLFILKDCYFVCEVEVHSTIGWRTVDMFHHIFRTKEPRVAIRFIKCGYKNAGACQL